jgi:NAD(P)-dependent dehydrogenase (short-subunit alcohol dehydrogenase family)
MKSLEGRVALVTGSGRGIGRAIAIRLAELGADIAINYRRDDAAAKETVAAIEALGRKAKAYQASVAEVEACEKMIGDVVADFGGLGILVNNAGIASRGKTVEDTDPAEFERVVHTHAFSAFYLSHFALPHMKKQDRGDIIMITSVATLRMDANGAPYNVGKAAMEALAQTMSKEVSRQGVYVNIVAPGLTVTEMGDRLAQATQGVKHISELDKKSAFGHVLLPEEVANVVGFLCSPENTYVSGQKLSLDGGNM